MRLKSNAKVGKFKNLTNLVSFSNDVSACIAEKSMHSRKASQRRGNYCICDVIIKAKTSK